MDPSLYETGINEMTVFPP